MDTVNLVHQYGSVTLAVDVVLDRLDPLLVGVGIENDNFAGGFCAKAMESIWESG